MTYDDTQPGERIYFWQDDEGVRCSPRHRTLRAALQFFKTPGERWVTEDGARRLVKVERGDFPSQKRPEKLVIGEFVIRELSPEELTKVTQVKQLMEDGLV